LVLIKLKRSDYSKQKSDMTQNFLNKNLLRKSALLCFLVSAVFLSCEKHKLVPVDPYPAPPKALVKFLDGAPSPSIGSEGTLVTFNVNGLKGKEGQFKFYMNQTEAEVVSVGENTLQAKVPATASTGGVAVLINGEYYFGPTFTVKGKVSIDPMFKADGYRSNGEIRGIFRKADGRYVIYGSFTNYKNQASESNPITGISILDKDCDYVPAASQLKLGKYGFNGSINSVIELWDGSFMVAGGFTKYDTIGNINGITRLYSDGSLDMMEVDVINPDPVNRPDDDKDIVPSFNGGVLGGIVKLFYDDYDYSTVVGNFGNYLSAFYERSTKTGRYWDIINTRQLVRMDYDGAFDSSFNYNYALNSSYAGGNGFIYDAIQLPDNSIIMVGNFTTFSGEAVNYITKINPDDGLPDPTFKSTGADGFITKITYNNTTGKILVTGKFKTFNGNPAAGVVMINPDGSTDPTFNLRVTEGGLPNYAGQLKNGKIIVSGSFNKYDNQIRGGLAILNPDGSLSSGYNNMGLFRGSINDLVELNSASNVPQVILVGNFDRFDGISVGNIVKLKIEN
jgi:hypothetical protein